MISQERAELLVILCGSKEKALEIVRDEMNGRGRLRTELKRLREDNRRAGNVDRDEELSSQGYEAALDFVEEFLDREDA